MRGIKKVIAPILALLIIVQGLIFAPISASAVDETGKDWTGYTPISTVDQLSSIRSNLSGKYYLTSDIVFTAADFAEGGVFYNGGAGWIPIGTSSFAPFLGTFDGNGHVISGLYCNISGQLTPDNNYVGLFGNSKGIIQNLGMIDSNINGTNFSSWYSIYIGGIVGSNLGIINNCYNTGVVNAKSLSKHVSVGGIAGYNSGSSANISNCYNEGNLSATSSQGSTSTGGISGYNESGSSISNCYNTGNISAISKLTSIAYAGGISGLLYSGSFVSNCYNTGNVSAIAPYAIAGGISGISSSAFSISNCYYLNTIFKGVGSGPDSTTVLTLEQMKNQYSYTGFDFTNTWQIYNYFPCLKANYVELTSLSFETKNVQLITGETYQTKILFTPTTPTFSNVEYTSMDTSIATVDKKGIISAIKAGTVNIIARDLLTYKVSICTVTIVQGVTEVSINGSQHSMDIGENMQLSATVSPTNAVNKTLIWSSSDNSIATVDQNGLVAADSPGAVTIFATSTDGTNIRTSFDITVIQYVESVSLNINSLQLKNGESQNLIVKVLPINATNKNVTWSSSNTTVATVDTTGKIIAKSRGTAVISVRTVDGGFEDHCTVTVLQQVTGVSFAQTTVNIGLGGQIKLNPIITPANANNQNVSWISSDPCVSVNSEGTITGFSEGQSIITVVTQDGNKSAVCFVNVGAAVTNIDLSKTQLSLVEGQSDALAVNSILPVDAINKEIRWASSNSLVATVDENGKVTAISPGIATISATATDGSGVFTNCNVEVVAKTITGITMNSKPTKTSYIQGQNLDVLGAKIVATYNDGTTQTVNVTAGMVSGYNANQAGTQIITATYNGKTTTFTVNVIATYTVTFYGNGGTNVASKTIIYNNLVQAPLNPTRSGYTFLGWYKELTGINPWYFATYKVTKDTTLYAKWISNPVAPTNVKSILKTYNSINTSWGAVSGANGYELWRSTTKTGTYALVATTTATNYTNTSLATGTTYYYKVRDYRMVGTTKAYSGYSAIVSARPVPVTPLNFKVVRASASSINTSWNAVSGASGYEIYRATVSTGTYGLAKTTSLSFVNTGLLKGSTYYYKVRAYRFVGTTKVYGSFSAVVYAKTY